MNREDVIDVLSVVAAATRRTVGETDLKIWQEVIGDDDKQLALKAVRDHLRDCPGVWLEPGHIHQRVRAAIRDRLEREPIEVKEARQRELDARFVEQVRELAGDQAVEPKFKPNRHPWNRVRCDYCKANPGQHCRDPHTGQPLRMSPAHPSRIEKAQS